MKEKCKKTFLQKMVIVAFTLILLINTIMPTVVYADKEDIGGVLFTPIQKLILSLGDAVMELVNSCCGANYSPVIRLAENEILFFSGNDNSISNIVNHSILYLVAAPVYPIAFCMEEISDTVSTDRLPDQLDIPFFAVSPDTIFANKVPMLNVNIINPPEDETSVADQMQSVVASWYNALRNLAIVGLLSVLVYVAIRIIISSTAADKSKYKQMLIDWLVAFCLLFFMHYIMSFAITLTETLTIAVTETGRGQICLPVTLGECEEKYGFADYLPLQALTVDTDGDDNYKDEYIRTNLMGYVRFLGQTNTIKDESGSVMARSGEARMTYTIMYVVLVIYTIMFVFIYMKRLIYIIFLTMISPLVALTYPIDKMNDGKAQAFNTWLKEYIFNLLLQPLHLILYTMLVSTAIQLAVDNLIYPLVVLGFLLQAEKVMRKLFGFEKSSTAGAMTGALGGALVMNGINALKSTAKSGGKIAAGAAGKGAGDDSKIKMDDGRKRDPGMNTDKLFGRAYPNAIPGSQNNSDNSKVPNFKDKAKAQLEQEMKEMQELARVNQADEEFMNDPIKWEENRQKEIEKQLEEDAKNQIRTKNADIYNTDNSATTDNINTNLDITGNNNETLNSGKPKQKVFQGAKSLAGRYIGDNIETIGKGLLKGTAKVAGAATLGTIGIAAGLASDDYSKVLTYGLGAGAVGAGLGGKLGEATWEVPSSAYKKVEEAKDIYNQGAYSKDDYDRMKNEELDKKFMKDKKVQQLYLEKFDRDEKKAKKAMEAAKKYRSYGITDNETIIKAMKAKSSIVNEDDYANEKRIITAKLAGQVNNEKDVQEAKTRLLERGVNNKDAEEHANMLRQIKDLV